jgi:hypothetical protein
MLSQTLHFFSSIEIATIYHARVRDSLRERLIGVILWLTPMSCFRNEAENPLKTLIEKPCVIGRLHLCAGVTWAETMQSS